MANQAPRADNSAARQPRHMLAVGASLVALALAIALNYAVGSTASVMLFYLLPIAVAAWLSGTRLAVLVCIFASAGGFVVGMTDRSFSGPIWWNAGMRFGVYLAFSIVLGHLRAHNREFPIFGVLFRAMGVAVVAACALAAAGSLLQRQLGFTQSQSQNAAKSDEAMAGAINAKSDRGVSLKELAALTESAMRVSRPVMLGSRDPNGPSCVAVVHSGEVTKAPPPNLADLDGGPGTRITTLVVFDRNNIKDPVQDFAWQQSRLKTFLQNEIDSSEDARKSVHLLCLNADKLSRLLLNSSAWPQDLVAAGISEHDNWLEYCLWCLDAAVREKNLDAARRWSAEFSAAVFSLEDLHRWLEFLARNQLDSLEFQSQCRTLFETADPKPANYVPISTISLYPGGVLMINSLTNYLEVERQAEILFGRPENHADQAEVDASPTTASLFIPPALRACYLKLQAVLSPASRKNWEMAARTEYEHSYLVNMLYRAWRADAADQLCEVLKRFNANSPDATLTSLLGALMYKGHSFAGLEWADRFQPQLMNAAASMGGSDTEAFMAACRWTNSFYRTPAEYGMTFSLREAFESKKLDCVRSTDMIGALFRDSGRSRFGNVWWSAGTAAHSVAAYLDRDENEPKTFLADGLNPPLEPEPWPDAYFNGHAWPAGMEKNAPPYAAELYVRGIDNYVLAEGYIIRGPNAGTLYKAGIPYLPLREKKTVTKVFDGPYPQ